jgi:tetratricopeptide (TPR) repeat protein
MAEALSCAERAQYVYAEQHSDPYIFFNSLAGKGYAHWHMGQKEKTRQIGEELLAFGREHSDLRALVFGHSCMGWSYLVDGDIQRAGKRFYEATRISTDPWYDRFPKLALCFGQVSSGAVAEARARLQEILAFSEQWGAEFLGNPAAFFLEVARVADGGVSEGLGRMEAMLDRWRQTGCRLRAAECGVILAGTLIQAAMHSPAGDDSSSGKAHLLKRAESHLIHCAETARQIGIQGLEATINLQMGRIYQIRSDVSRAGECFRKAVEGFRAMDALVHLQESEKALRSLEPGCA